MVQLSWELNLETFYFWIQLENHTKCQRFKEELLRRNDEYHAKEEVSIFDAELFIALVSQLVYIVQLCEVF